MQLFYFKETEANQKSANDIFEEYGGVISLYEVLASFGIHQTRENAMITTQYVWSVDRNGEIIPLHKIGDNPADADLLLGKMQHAACADIWRKEMK